MANFFLTSMRFVFCSSNLTLAVVRLEIGVVGGMMEGGVRREGKGAKDGGVERGGLKN